MDFGIKGKWALVGGASKGLGWGCARALALEGVNVVMVARGAEVLNQSVADLQKEAPGVKLIAVAADITTEAGRAALFSVAGGPGKDFDIVVTNAGGPPPGDFRNWDREAWIKAIDANMLTPIELIKATVDGMAARGFGRIVNITSSSVKSPIDILGLSNGARSGLTGFVAGVARTKIAAQGVTLNNILPGRFDTDRIRTNVEALAQIARHERFVDLHDAWRVPPEPLRHQLAFRSPQTRCHGAEQLLDVESDEDRVRIRRFTPGRHLREPADTVSKIQKLRWRAIVQYDLCRRVQYVNGARPSDKRQQRRLVQLLRPPRRACLRLGVGHRRFRIPQLHRVQLWHPTHTKHFRTTHLWTRSAQQGLEHKEVRPTPAGPTSRPR